MAIFPFYNVRKPRQYDHKPIYWDPRREALEERIRKIHQQLNKEEGTNPEEYRPSIKGTFIEGTSHLKKSISRGDTPRDRTSRNMRLLLILVILLIVFWWLFFRQ